MADASWEKEAALVAEALNLLIVLAVPRLSSHWYTQATPTELHAALTARMAALADL